MCILISIRASAIIATHERAITINNLTSRLLVIGELARVHIISSELRIEWIAIARLSCSIAGTRASRIRGWHSEH
jgi:hypothetical protein